MEPTTLAAWLVTVFVHLGLLLFLARRLTRRMDSGRARERLWRLALGGALVTASLQSVSANGPLIWHVPSPSSAGSVTVQVGHSEITSPLLDPETATALFDSEALGTVSVPPTGARVLGAGWLGWTVVCAWALGALFLLGRQQRARQRFIRQLGRRPLRGHEELDGCLSRTSYTSLVERNVRLSVSDALSSPMVLSRREVCLPQRMLKEFSPLEFEATLRHECAHIARLDPLWLRLYAALEAVFFFQPLVKTATAALRSEAELACDDWAIQRGASPLGLARSLARIAEWEPMAPAWMNAMLGGESGLVGRVQRLTSVEPTQTSGPRNILCGAAFVLALGFFACGGPSVETSDNSPPPVQSAEPKLTLHVQADGVLRVHDESFHPPEDWSKIEAYLSAQDPTLVESDPSILSDLEVVIQVEPGVGFDRIQMLMETLSRVRIWRIEFATRGEGTIEVPLPHDFEDLPQPVEIREETEEPSRIFAESEDGSTEGTMEVMIRRGGGEVSRLVYRIKGRELDNLEQVTKILVERMFGEDLKSVTIDARGGVLYKDVIALMDTLMTSTGQADLSIYFVGSYDSDWR